MTYLYITIICVCIIDISGFADTVKSAIKYILTRGKFSGSDYPLKPIDCSFCCSFWANIIYMFCKGEWSILSITLILGLSVMTPVIKDFILLIRDFLLSVADYIRRKVGL